MKRFCRSIRIVVNRVAYMLLADHYVEDHVVGVLHSDRADTAEILYCFLYVLLDDAVVFGDTDSFSREYCGLE